MKVYFAGSNHKLEERISRFREIIYFVTKEGHTITRDWVEEDLARQNRGASYSVEDYEDIWRDVKKAILESDVVIFDVSKNSFSIGYQTAFALSNKKPVLVLSNNTKISSTIIIGEDNPLLTIAQYDQSSLEHIIENFFLKFGGTKKDMRFNMLLDRETQVYLELESYRSGRAKARIIRDLLNDTIKSKTGL